MSTQEAREGDPGVGALFPGGDRDRLLVVLLRDVGFAVELGDERKAQERQRMSAGRLREAEVFSLSTAELTFAPVRLGDEQLEKAWKLVLLGAFAFFAAISKIIKAIFTREDRIA